MDVYRQKAVGERGTLNVINEGKGVFVWVLGSYMNNLFPELQTPPLRQIIDNR